MSSPYDKDYSTLNWIKGQVDQRLEQARFKLEEAESGGTPAEELGDCASYLHEVRGSLRMVELYGPTMVVEEMERLTRQLAAGKVEDNDTAYSAIMRGLVQLPDYLDRIQSGHRDVPTALLPLLNEVREAGGRDKLDEAHIFSPRLSIPVPEKYRGAPRRIKLDQQKAAAAKLRLAFQSSLANWMREQGNPDAQLKRMMKVVEMLRKASAEAPMWRMLWALEGVLEALLVDGLDANQDVRSAMRQVDRELKRFAEGGDPEMRRRPPDDLTRALLYHVTVCKATSPKVTQLRETYGLVELLPRPEELSHAEGAMAGRNRELLGTVASAIREDIYRIKDALDVFIGDETPDPQSLASLSEKLDSVADTLGMLGMNRPRQRVLDQAQVLNDIVNGVREADEEALMGIAGNLLRVEAALDDQQSSLGSEDDEDDETGETGKKPPQSEVRKVVVSLMGEGLTNLARAKSALNDYMADPSESRLIEAVPEMLSDVSGALRMVQLDTLADACGSVSRFVARIREFGPQPQFMDTLADALSIIEMYMEVVRDQQPGRQRLSEQLTQVLVKLAAIEDELAEEASEPTVDQAQADQAQAEPVAEAQPQPAPEPEHEPEPESQPEPAASVAPGIEFAEDIDDDIREVFVEEVEEELAKVRKLYPIWRNDNDDQESLTTLRRCFHTLKGSGRLVGARSIGEFAWSIENLYNRIIDKTIEIDDNVYKVLDDAADALEQLYGQLKDGSAVSIDVQDIEQRAFALADGKPLPEPAAAQPQAEVSEQEASAADEQTEAQEQAPEQVASEQAATAPDQQQDDEDSIEAVLEAEADDEQAPLDLHPDDQLPDEGKDWTLAEDDSVSDADPADAVDADTLLSEGEQSAEDSLEVLATVDDEDEQAMDSLLRGWDEEESAEAQEPEQSIPEQAYDEDAEHEPDDSALATAESDDQQLMAIFEKEARGHVESLREYVAASEQAARPLAIDVDLLRAAHTLNGAACMARIEAVSDIAGVLEGYVKGLSQEKKRPSKHGLACFADAVNHFTSVLDRIAAGETDLPLNPELADRTRALLEELSDPSLTKASMSDILESGSIDEDDFETSDQESELELDEPDSEDASVGGISAADAEAADSWALEGGKDTKGDSIELTSDDDEESLDDLIAGWDDDSAEDEDASAAATEIPGFDSGWDLDESDSDSDLAFDTQQDESLDEPAGLEESSAGEESDASLREPALDLSDDEDSSDDYDFESIAAEHVEGESSDEAMEATGELIDQPDDPQVALEATGEADEATDIDDAPEASPAETEEPSTEALADAEPEPEQAPVAEADSSDFDAEQDLERLLDEAPHETDDTMALEDPDQAADVGPLLADDTGQEAVGAVAAERPWEADPELLEVFLEEGAEILDSLDEQVQHLRDGDTSGNVLSSLQRELHTLKGSARMASVEPVGDLAHRLETLLEACSHGKRAVDSDVVSATESVLDHLHNAISSLQNHKDLPDPSAVEDRLADALDEPASDKPAALPAEPTEPAAAPEAEQPSEVGEERLVELADDADAELVEIFMQEGREILDAADGLVEKLRDSADDIDPAILEDLQRELHTLKGGARMAGVEPIGELGHNLESLLEKVTTADGAPDASLLSLVVRVLDYLNRQLTALEAGQSMPAGEALNKEIHRYIEGGNQVVESRPEQTAEAEPVDAEPATEPEEPAEETPETPAKEQPIEAAQAQPAGRAGLLDFGPISSVSAISGANIIPLTRGAAARAGGQGRKESTEVVRVRSSLLDNLVNYAGEVSIYRSRLEQQMSTFRFNLVEFDQTVSRLREQLRKMEIETEAQILSRHQREQEAGKLDFDPLELDRYSQLQLLSRSLSESLSDLVSIQDLLEDLTRESETLLLQQSRVSGELQEGLMRTRMVPFSNVVPRLRRIVRQTTSELGKQARLVVEGAEGEMDRTVLEKLTPPLEHMLRNALGHGLETPEERNKAGKPDEGTVTVNVAREASEVVVRVTDDGAGINLDRVRARAIERGLMAADAELGERDIMRFIMEAGFSTAETVTKLSGRGVGMDVVNSEIKQLNGTLDIDSELGKGTTFTVRLPFTLSVSQAIMIKLADEEYAVPLSSIEGVYRMPRDEFEDTIQDAEGKVRYAGTDYTLYDLGLLLGRDSMEPPEEGNVPLLMIRTGDQRAAVRVERLLGSREIVIKSVGPQLSSIPGVSGATVLGDGSVVLILDLAPLARKAAALHRQQPELAEERVAEFDTSQDRQLRIMVVDDSITMRKVATRMLERHDFEVHTAKDGVDAVASLHDMVPDLMLLDIEMPRMDGYELATHVRNTSRLKHVPIIMITSRTGQKHRQRAFDIGVDRYLGKPYQEAELLATINELLGREVAELD